MRHFSLIAALTLIASTAATAAPTVQTIRSRIQCGITVSEAKRRLPPDHVESCENVADGTTTQAFKYGRTWVFFKGGAARFIVDHRDFHGVCNGWMSKEKIDLCE